MGAGAARGRLSCEDEAIGRKRTPKQGECPEEIPYLPLALSSDLLSLPPLAKLRREPARKPRRGSAQVQVLLLGHGTGQGRKNGAGLEASGEYSGRCVCV